MKIFKLSAFVAVVLATMVFGCQPEAVGPKNKGGIGKSETGWDPHSGNLVDCMKEYCALKSSEMKFPDFNFYGGGVFGFGLETINQQCRYWPMVI